MFRGVGGVTLIQVGGRAALKAGDLRGHMRGVQEIGGSILRVLSQGKSYFEVYKAAAYSQKSPLGVIWMWKRGC